MASKQEKSFCVLRFEMSRFVITVQCEFRAQFKKDIILVWCVFFKPCMKLALRCNLKSEHLKTEHTENFLLLRRHLGNWSRGPAISVRRELLVVRKKLRQFPLLKVYVVPVQDEKCIFINF
jgi:hypothetical protein